MKPTGNHKSSHIFQKNGTKATQGMDPVSLIRYWYPSSVGKALQCYKMSRHTAFPKILHVRPRRQINLRNHTVWSESSLSALRRTRWILGYPQMALRRLWSESLLGTHAILREMQFFPGLNNCFILHIRVVQWGQDLTNNDDSDMYIRAIWFWLSLPAEHSTICNDSSED